VIKLPCDECGAKCCTYPLFTPKEYKKVKKKYGIPECQEIDFRGAKILIDENGMCPYLSDELKCTIYEIRPTICKQYGINKKMPCKYLYPEKAEALVNDALKNLL